jgi:hypothetical protein
MHPDTHSLQFNGMIWTVDSWDGETFTVEMRDAHGNVMDSKTYQGNNFANMADETVQCEGSVGGWQDGYFNVQLNSAYDASKGDVTIRITNSLDQGAGDESIGYGNMDLMYEFDDGNQGPTTSPADYDNGDTDATRYW